MLPVNIKKLLLCLVFAFTESLCMEIVQLPNDEMQPIAGWLTFVERHNLKNSCKSLYEKLHKEPLFLSPFNSVNYHKFINVQDNYLPLKQIASAGIILKLKIFAARQKNREMLSDLVARYPQESCAGEICMFNFIEKTDKLIEIYAKEWPSDNKGNSEHFYFIEQILDDHSCKPYIDLVFAQGIDVNATTVKYCETILHKVCRLDHYEWFLRKLVDNRLCNVNAINCSGNTPLHIAASNKKNSYIKILLTCGNRNINVKNIFKETPLRLALYPCIWNSTYNLLLTADPFQKLPF